MDHPFLDVQCKRCSDGTAGNLFIEVFSTPEIATANKANKNLPKYGFHFGAVCPRCGNFICHLKQTDVLVGKKFMLIPE